MHLNDNTVPGNYQQPIKNFTGRIVSNNVEEIDFAPNSNVRIWYNNRAEDYPLHKHSILEIAIPTDGSYSYVFEDRTIVLNEKDILIVPPDTLHKISGTRAGIRIIFLFNIDFMKGFFDYAELKALLSEPIVINETTYPDLYNPIYYKLIAISDLYFFYTSSIKEIPIFGNHRGDGLVKWDETEAGKNSMFGICRAKETESSRRKTNSSFSYPIF